MQLAEGDLRIPYFNNCHSFHTRVQQLIPVRASSIGGVLDSLYASVTPTMQYRPFHSLLPALTKDRACAILMSSSKSVVACRLREIKYVAACSTLDHDSSVLTVSLVPIPVVVDTTLSPSPPCTHL